MILLFLCVCVGMFPWLDASGERHGDTGREHGELVGRENGGFIGVFIWIALVEFVRMSRS